jgi:hypothetical protein
MRELLLCRSEAELPALRRLGTVPELRAIRELAGERQVGPLGGYSWR